MSKILKSNVKVVKKFHLKRRLELKLTAFVVKNCALIFKISLPQENFVSGGLACTSTRSCTLLV